MILGNDALVGRDCRPLAVLVLFAWAPALLACAGNDMSSAGTGDVPGVPGTAGTAQVPAAGLAAVAGQLAAGAGGQGALPVAGDTSAAGTIAGAVAAAGTAAPIAGMTAVAGVGEPAAGVMAMAGVMASAGTSGAVAGTAPTAGTQPASGGDVCERWSAVRANLNEGTWNGSAASCEAGDMTPESRAAALDLVNLYRSLAGNTPVEMSDEGNRLAQGCSLLMAANMRISHSPTESWACYTAEAARTAAASSLSQGPALASVDGYMVDPGNPTTLGHRRWILSNMLEGIGFGSAGRFSCQYQPAGRPAAGAPEWLAWPPPGQVPFQSLATRWSSIDQTGWSVQSDRVNLRDAQVSVTSGGSELPVTGAQLLPGYGSSYALRFNPRGWETSPGQTYHVAITGIATPIEYDVEVVDCP